MQIVRVERGAEVHRDGAVVGRLTGTVHGNPLSGSYIWSRPGDHTAEDPEFYRDLYAVAGALWVEQGARSHYVVIPAREPVVWAWLRLSFAIQQVHGECSLHDVEPPRAPTDFAVRVGGIDDLEAAVRLAPVVARHQLEAPIWSEIPVPEESETRATWSQTLADPTACWLLAERDGQPLGGLLLTTRPGQPHLQLCATLPHARGRGVGVALTEHAFWWARSRGHDCITIDWKAANILGSRFWTRRGFLETEYRMVRHIGAS